jgi:hypothetical protein
MGVNGQFERADARLGGEAGVVVSPVTAGNGNE